MRAGVGDRRATHDASRRSIAETMRRRRGVGWVAVIFLASGILATGILATGILATGILATGCAGSQLPLIGNGGTTCSDRCATMSCPEGTTCRLSGNCAPTCEMNTLAPR